VFVVVDVGGERLSKDASWTMPPWRRNENVMRQVSTVLTVGRQQLSQDSLDSPNQWHFVLQNATFAPLLSTF
jgi:hypothetical protein